MTIDSHSGAATGGSAVIRRSGAAPALPLRSVLAVVVRPQLWWTALRTAHRLAPQGWWRRAPYLPVPDPGYWRYRIVTAYGGDGTRQPETDDLITYLKWCRSWPAATRR